jgi:hypothetical protein
LLIAGKLPEIAFQNEAFSGVTDLGKINVEKFGERRG